MKKEPGLSLDNHPALSPQCKALDQKSWKWIGLLGIGISFAALSALLDYANRASLEKLSQPTAVGDQNWFKSSQEPRPSITWDGKVLCVVNGQLENIPDSKMLCVGRSDDGALRLYVPQERANGTEETGGPSWFVKTGPNEFLRLTR